MSTTACHLLGYPGVVLSDAGGAKLPFHYRQGGDLEITGHAPGPVELQPGRSAHVTINHSTCALEDKAVARAIDVVPPGSSAAIHLALSEYPVVAYCGAGQPGSTVAVSPVEPSLAATLSS